VSDVLAGLPITVPLPSSGAKGRDRALARRVAAPFTLAARLWSRLVIASITTPHTGKEKHPMITETPTTIIVLQLTDELFAQLHPFMAGLGISVSPYAACSGQAEQHLRLTMRAEVYETLAERVGEALDYDVRWQPNEYEPDGFVERVRPLQLTYGILITSNFPKCGVQLLANCAEVTCVCGQAVELS
jgi:hypothetical protein